MNVSVAQSITACVMCGTPLPTWRPLGGVVCVSQRCAAQHAALLPTFKCAQCTRPLTMPQRATGHCDHVACRDSATRERRAAAEQIETDLIERLVLQRAYVAPDRGVPADEQATYRLAILPFNDDRTSPLPLSRRTRHEEHLRQQLSRAHVRRASSPDCAAIEAFDPASQPSSPTEIAESRLMLAACASCRGECCRQGGDTAFITDETMLAVLQRFPSLDDDAIIAHYMQHIGDDTMSLGCVYQGDRGCTLAPELRAEVCHSFHCTGLRMMKDKYVEGAPMRAYFVHRRGGHVTSDRFVEITVADDV